MPSCGPKSRPTEAPSVKPNTRKWVETIIITICLSILLLPSLCYHPFLLEKIFLGRLGESITVLLLATQKEVLPAALIFFICFTDKCTPFDSNWTALVLFCSNITYLLTCLINNVSCIFFTCHSKKCFSHIINFVAFSALSTATDSALVLDFVIIFLFSADIGIKIPCPRVHIVPVWCLQPGCTLHDTSIFHIIVLLPSTLSIKSRCTLLQKYVFTFLTFHNLLLLAIALLYIKMLLLMQYSVEHAYLCTIILQQFGETNLPSLVSVVFHLYWF